MDDISLLAIKYKGKVDPKIYYRSILLNNDVQEVPVLTVFIVGICDDMKFDKLARAGVSLAVEEAVVNVMNYAYAPDERGNIQLEVTADETVVSFVLKDKGKPFDPTAMPEVDVDDYVATRSVGGLGIHLIRNYMDEVNYQHTNGENVLMMKKNLKTTN